MVDSPARDHPRGPRARRFSVDYLSVCLLASMSHERIRLIIIVCCDRASYAVSSLSGTTLCEPLFANFASSTIAFRRGFHIPRYCSPSPQTLFTKCREYFFFFHSLLPDFSMKRFDRIRNRHYFDSFCKLT